MAASRLLLLVFAVAGTLPAAQAVFAPASSVELKTAVDACIAESPAGTCINLAAKPVPAGLGTGPGEVTPAGLWQQQHGDFGPYLDPQKSEGFYCLPMSSETGKLDFSRSCAFPILTKQTKKLKIE